MTFVIKIVKLVIWGILHYRVYRVRGSVYRAQGSVYVELGVVFRWFWALLQYISASASGEDINLRPAIST